MDGRGRRRMGNLFIERRWRSLKYEAVYLHESADGFEARRLLSEWVRFYNTERPHSALDGRTPAEAWRGGTPVEMRASRSAPCPHLHRRNSSNRKRHSSKPGMGIEVRHYSDAQIAQWDAGDTLGSQERTRILDAVTGLK